MTAICHQCGDRIHITGMLDILNHNRLIHPDIHPIDRWPDGQPVIVDLTLTPDDFMDAT